MNWDDPEERLHLIEQVGITEYNRRINEHITKSIIVTVNGYSIRPVSTQWGRLFAVGGTKKAFSTQAQAEEYAKSL